MFLIHFLTKYIRLYYYLYFIFSYEIITEIETVQYLFCVIIKDTPLSLISFLTL